MREEFNCPNCGAPINNERCEYCGTQFYDLADLQLNCESFLRVKINDKILLLKVIPREVTLEHSFNTYPYLTMGFTARQIMAKERE